MISPVIQLKIRLKPLRKLDKKYVTFLQMASLKWQDMQKQVPRLKIDMGKDQKPYAGKEDEEAEDFHHDEE